MHSTDNNIKRAHIFQSFDALKGFREILKEQERIVVPKKVLSEDEYEALNRKIQCIHPGMVITVTYYDSGQYVLLEGKVSKINFDTRFIQIIKSKIDIKSIVDIRGNDILQRINNKII